TRARAARDQVELAVRVHVSQGARRDRNSVGDHQAGAEGAVSVAEDDLDLGEAGNREVEVAVGVQVSGRDAAGRRSREALDRAKGAVTLADPHEHEVRGLMRSEHVFAAVPSYVSVSDESRRRACGRGEPEEGRLE